MIERKACAASLLLLLTCAAQAHVTLEQGIAPAGGSYKAVFKVGHGCGQSPTLKLRVQIPEGVVSVKPMPKAGWSLDTVRGKYEKSYEIFHGSVVAEGVKEVIWTGKLENKFYDEFVMSVFLTSGLAANAPLYFPVVQECETGANRWTEIPAGGGHDHHDHLKSPAPALMILPGR